MKLLKGVLWKKYQFIKIKYKFYQIKLQFNNVDKEIKKMLDKEKIDWIKKLKN